jgi:uncharacterized protein (TIGR01777 family)
METSTEAHQSLVVFVTGATGFVGRAVTLALLGAGHRVVAWVRDEARARATLGANVELVSTDCGEEHLVRQLEGCDAVINLAGAPIATRWTAARRRDIVRSRVDLTRRLVHALARAGRRPDVLISTSAVGVYGNTRGDESLHATSEIGDGFAARLCVDWEQAARAAGELGVRVVIIRVGLVLGREGGVFGRLSGAFRAGLGGRLGRGDQFMPWVHLDDLVRLYLRGLADPNFEGVFEGVGPRPVTNREFTRALGAALSRPTWATVPESALRLAFGESAELLLASHRVHPDRTIAHGFEYRYTTVDEALNSLVDAEGVEIRRADPREVPDAEYLRRRRPRYVLEQHTKIRRPLRDLVPFFERPENLGPLTPPRMAFEIRGEAPSPLRAGDRIDYRIHLGPVPMKWRTEISEHGPRGFVDAQLRGPYRAWYHEHRFFEDEDGTHMVDRVHYAPPLGPLGVVAHRLFVAPMLRRIFAYRAAAIRRRFPKEMEAASSRDDRAA